MFGQNDAALGGPQDSTNDPLNAAMPDPVQTTDTSSTMQPPAGWGLDNATPTGTPAADPVSDVTDPNTDLDTTAAEVEAAAKIAEAAVADSTPSDPVTTSPVIEDAPATAPIVDTPAAPAPAGPVPVDELNGLKQEVMQHLSPLVGQLDQAPEEKFRTTMMMIQASDNHTLIKDAFEAAKQITDDKARAQAFLDVINEINYFSQQGEQNAA